MACERLRRAMGVAVLAGGVAAGAGPARARGIAIVARARPGAPAPAAQVAHAAAGAVTARGDRAVKDAQITSRAQVAAGAVPAARLAPFGRARALARDGWRDYLAVDFAHAKSLLEDAATAALAVVPLAGGRALLADIILRQGAVALAMGDGPRARADFSFARILDPEREVTIARFSPDVVKSYAELLAPVGPMAWTVQTDPPGAQLKVDSGEPRPAPLTVQVARGRHLVVARAPGRLPAAAMATVTAPLVTRVGLAPDPAAAVTAPLALGTTMAEALPALAAVTRFSGASAVVVVVAAWHGGRPAALAQACTIARAPLACGRVIEVTVGDRGSFPMGDRGSFPAAAGGDRGSFSAAAGGDRGSFSAAVAAAVGGALDALDALEGVGAKGHGPTLLNDPRAYPGEAAPAPRPPPLPTEGRGSVWKNPLLWIGVGTVTALAAGTTLYLVTRDHETAPVIGVDVCDTFIHCP
ncbi:MAG TPA: hypothetical protein VFG83_01785 [Kofleriaceae bacterium]|nr:hypothetical protein [Kofleriaceae bacterium]